MLFYESERSDQHNYLYCQRDHNFNFPAHLHHSFEFLCVQSGTLACTLETEQYEVHPVSYTHLDVYKRQKQCRT